MDIVDILIRDEGLRLKAYDDATGQELKQGDTLKGKLTIGIGRNLTDNGITEHEARSLLADDLVNVQIQAQSFAWYSGLNDARKNVVLSLIFNMGFRTLLMFRKFLACMSAGDFDGAAHELENSLWATQVGARAGRLTTMLRNGA